MWHRDSKEHKVKLQRYYSTKAQNMLRIPTVFSFLYLKLQELRKNTVKSVARSYDSFVDKYEEVRDMALDAGDFSATLKAHGELGILLGHKKESGEAGGSLSDAQLIKTIAAGNLELTKALSAQLGVKVIEHDNGG